MMAYLSVIDDTWKLLLEGIASRRAQCRREKLGLAKGILRVDAWTTFIFPHCETNLPLFPDHYCQSDSNQSHENFNESRKESLRY